MGIILESLNSYVSEFLPTNNLINRLKIYSNELIVWNERINLTAITEPSEIAEKHFLDCLLTFKFANIEENASVIDVGTGAGFPGMVLKVARPDLNVTLLDSLNKRLVFLNELSEKLNAHCNIIHSRAEDGAKTELRESFDYAVSRAVARLPVLSEYCLPYVKLGGKFIALKGPGAEEEIESSSNALKVLGGEIEENIEYNLPSGDRRTLIIIKKTSQTPTKYPRIGIKISKKPL